MTDVEWRSPLGETREQADRRRAAQKDIVRLLQDDLYRRDETATTDHGMTWESPLGWHVTFTASAVGWQVHIHDPRGELHSILNSPPVEAVDAALP